MAAPATLQPPSGTYPIVELKTTPGEFIRVREFPEPEIALEERASIFKTAYRYICSLGQRWRTFGDKFRAESIRPDNNWIERQTGRRFSDFREMY
jgi:hypothetical protein